MFSCTFQAWLNYSDILLPTYHTVYSMLYILRIHVKGQSIWVVQKGCMRECKFYLAELRMFRNCGCSVIFWRAPAIGSASGYAIWLTGYQWGFYLVFSIVTFLLGLTLARNARQGKVIWFYMTNLRSGLRNNAGCGLSCWRRRIGHGGLNSFTLLCLLDLNCYRSRWSLLTLLGLVNTNRNRCLTLLGAVDSNVYVVALLLCLLTLFNSDYNVLWRRIDFD